MKKPIKVDKETQKRFEEFAEFQKQNDGLLCTLMNTLDRINGRLYSAHKEIWEEASKKYKLDTGKNHVYNRKRKEITEKDSEVSDEGWIRRETELLEKYTNLAKQMESLAKFVEPQKREARMRLETTQTGAYKICEGNLEKQFFTPDGDGKKLRMLLESLEENDEIEIIFREKK